jgi:hypothetical protein
MGVRGKQIAVLRKPPPAVISIMVGLRVRGDPDSHDNEAINPGSVNIFRELWEETESAESLHAPQKLVIGLVGADPKPVEVVTRAVCDSAIGAAHIDCPNRPFLLQPQRRVKRVPLEKHELVVRERLRVIRKCLLTFPELRQCEGAQSLPPLAAFS